MPRPNQNRASEDAADGPAYVLDYQDQYGHFIHKLETPRRAELLARLLLTTFSGNDRGDQATDAFRWFVGADKLAEELAKFKAVYGIDIPVIEFAGKIPSLQTATEAVNAEAAGGAAPAAGADGAAAAPRPRNANALQGSALQDALFAKLKNFFAEILPPDTLEERKGKTPVAQAAPAADGTVLTEDQM